MIIRITYNTLVENGAQPPDNFFEIMDKVMEERHKRVLKTMIEETMEDIIWETLERCDMNADAVLVKKILERIEEAPFCKMRKETPRVIRVLKSMGFKLGVVSNAPSTFPRKILRRHGLLKYFDAVIISCEVKYRKPAAKIFQIALEKLGLRPRETIFVGDVKEIDIYGAKKLGMITVLMKYGDPDWKKRANYLKKILPYNEDPDFEIENLEELLDIVKQLISSKKD